MAVIVVGGSEKGVGKTTLVCGQIAALREYCWIAVKITSHDYGRPESIWEETAIAAPMDEVPATDTARFLAAGAHRALLVTVEEAATHLKVAELLKQLEPAANIIFESNHAVPDAGPMSRRRRRRRGRSESLIRRIPSQRRRRGCFDQFQCRPRQPAAGLAFISIDGDGSDLAGDARLDPIEIEVDQLGADFISACRWETVRP